MNIKIHILDASGNLSSRKNLMRQTVKASVKKVQRKISLDNIDILIRESDSPELLKDLNGIGAYCPSGHFVQLAIDINHSSFGKSPAMIIEKSLIHELHHASRRQAGVKIDNGSFLECLISEGLADYFVYEITGDLPKWTTAVRFKNKKTLLAKVKQMANTKMTPQKYEDWFIAGSKRHKIPRWTGYALGFEIVKNFLEKNPEKSAGSLITIPVEKIFTTKDKEQYIR